MGSGTDGRKESQENTVRRLWELLSESYWSGWRWFSGDRNAGDDPLNEADKAYNELDEDKYKAEVELVDRYQSYVAELLRLSLLGIAVFGFLYKEMLAEIDQATLGPLTITFFWFAKILAALSVIAFGIAAGSALIFRFAATEGARYYIEGLRFREANDPERAKGSLKVRKDRIVIARLTKPLAVFLLGLGSALATLSLVLLLIFI